MGMRSNNVELQIQELVLHGFSPADGRQISDAIRTELARQLADHGPPELLARGGRITQRDAGAFDVRPGSRANTVGLQVAQSVYQGLKR